MSDLADDRLAWISERVATRLRQGDDVGTLFLQEIADLVAETVRRRAAHRTMLHQVEDLRRYVERGDSRHPFTVDAVGRILDAIQKAGG